MLMKYQYYNLPFFEVILVVCHRRIIPLRRITRLGINLVSRGLMIQQNLALDDSPISTSSRCAEGGITRLRWMIRP